MREVEAPALGLADAQAVLSSQPFSALLGTRVTEFGAGRAVLELDHAEQLRQQYGFVHGGVLAYLADNAITFAAGTVLGPAVLTAGVSISYLAPARGDLRASAEVVSVAGRTAECRCEIVSGGVVCATATGSVRRTSRAAAPDGPPY